MNKILDFLKDGEYCIAYRKISDNSQGLIKEGGKFELLRANWHFWYADPLLFKYQSRLYVFMEVYDRFNKKGFIGVSYFNKKGKLTKPRKVIEESFHLSFPCVFKHGDNIYMVPESSESECILIYKMQENIYKWQLCNKYKNMKNIVDTFAFENGKDGKIYFLSSKEKLENKCFTKLQLFAASNIGGEQLENISDKLLKQNYSLEERNAGRLLELNNHLYRISQKSKDNEYGISFKFNHIVNLDTLEEKMIREVTVDDIGICIMPLITKKKGTHTYSRIDNIEVIDILLGKINIGNIYRKLKKSKGRL